MINFIQYTIFVQLTISISQNVTFGSVFKKSIVRHPEYSPIMKKNDIALIRLTNPIEFDADVKPACLQTDSRDEDADTKLIITGWGIVSTESKLFS